MTVLPGSLLPLAPTLIALVGALLAAALAARGRVDRLLITFGEGVLALAFGVTSRLVVATFGKPVQTYDPFGVLASSGQLVPVPATALAAEVGSPLPAILGVARPDLLALIASLLLLALAAATLATTSVPPSRTVAGILLATSAGLYAMISPVPVALGLAWLALALAPTFEAWSGLESDPVALAAPRSTAPSWLLFGVSTAAVFFFTHAALGVDGRALLDVQPAPRGVSALLILLAASAAEVGPLGGAVRKLGRLDESNVRDAPAGRFVVVGVLPIVAFLLAARVLVASPAAPTLLLRGFVIFLVIWSIGGALVGRFSYPERSARVLVALAFLVLAALPILLAFVGFAILAVGIAVEAAGAAVLGMGTRRSALIALPHLGLTEWFEELALPETLGDVVRDLAAFLRQIEERYDLAVGLLLALAAVSAFGR